jgi:hypothetical protein
MRVFYLFGRERKYNRAMMRIQEIGNHPCKEEIEKRLKAIWLLGTWAVRGVEGSHERVSFDGLHLEEAF